MCMPWWRSLRCACNVVVHSAGHGVHSCLACTTKVGNHDIFHSRVGVFLDPVEPSRS